MTNLAFQPSILVSKTIGVACAALAMVMRVICTTINTFLGRNSPIEHATFFGFYNAHRRDHDPRWRRVAMFCERPFPQTPGGEYHENGTNVD